MDNDQTKLKGHKELSDTPVDMKIEVALSATSLIFSVASIAMSILVLI